jgi:hypothetical protein
MAYRTPANTQPPLIKPSFRAAIQWMADNDDTEWLEDDEPILSVTAALVADLFGAEPKRVIRSLRRALAKARDAQTLSGETPND